MLFELEPECAMAGVGLATAHPSRKMPKTLTISNDDSHPRTQPNWNGFSARLRSNATECPRLQLAAGCLGKCKVAFSAASRKARGHEQLERGSKRTVLARRAGRTSQPYTPQP